MRYPDFIIVGAMKSGTTTLYRDLMMNPHIFMPADKEPANLCHDEVRTTAGRSEYAEHFRFAAQTQVCGEASTNYTKLPKFPGVPERARDVCGENLRVIYLVREPIARVISHHYHLYSIGIFGPDIDRVVREKPTLIDYSRYSMQITPWIETFGRDQVEIIVFEEYISSRRPTVRRLCEFLGVPDHTGTIDEASAFNRSDRKLGRSRIWDRARKSPIYRRYVQPRVPIDWRDRLRELVYPKGPDRPSPPRPETIRFIRDELASDLAQFQRLLNRTEPIWPDASLREPTS